MRGKKFRLTILIADLTAMFTVLLLAYLLHYGRNLRGVTEPWGPLLILGASAASWLSLYELMSLDCFSSGWDLPATLSRIVLATAVQMGLILAVAHFAGLYSFRRVLVDYAMLFSSLVLVIRLVAYSVLQARRRTGETRRVVLIGEGRVALELRRRIERHPELLYEVVGLLNPSMQPSNGREGKPGNSSCEFSSLEALDVLKEKGVSELIVCLEQPPVPELQNFFHCCREQQIRVSLLPQPYELYSSQAKLFEIDGVPLICLEPPGNREFASRFKRGMDLLLATILLIPAFPITLVASGVLWCQGRCFLRRERRCGRYGEAFWMYRLDVDRQAHNATAFQRFLSQLSISELPQLFNVLLGQMSLVGPRPESPERVREYSEWQRQRLRTRPGMTGLAQVNGLREQHSSEEKTRYDLQYMLNWTPMVDPVLLLQTVWTLASRLGREHEVSVVLPRPARALESSSAAAGSFPR
jgi:lipopolysaccharide/colanic/teichoic acid biosynthesis glycosyltransferase